MEPGHEDREYRGPMIRAMVAELASMEPGHEDREYMMSPIRSWCRTRCLNGARS